MMWTWLRSFANSIFGRTGKPNRLDVATRMAMEGDFNDRSEPSTQARTPTLKMDQISLSLGRLRPAFNLASGGFPRGLTESDLLR